MRREYIMNCLSCRPGAPAVATLHWWGLYKFAHAGILSGYEDSDRGWSLNGEALAEVDGRFYDDFRPATFHLSAGQCTGRRAKWFFDQTEEETSSLLRAVRNLESYSVLDEYLDSLRITKEETLAGQEFAHVTALRKRYGPEAVLLLNEGNPISSILTPGGCMDFENGLVQMLENPEKMAYLTDGAYRAILPRMEALKEAGADGYIGSEQYCTPDIMSPDMWRNLILPSQKMFYESITDMGLIPVVYFLGDILPILEDIKGIGAKALMVEETKKGYDLDIGRIYDGLERQMCLFGNVDSVYILQMGTPDDVRREAERQLKACSRGGFILSNGCPISFGTPEENLRALLSAAGQEDA